MQIMEAVARLIKVQLPNYLRSLPIPSTLGRCAELSGQEWIELVPFVVTTSVVIYVVIKAFAPKNGGGAHKNGAGAHKKEAGGVVNLDKEKHKDKVVNITDVEDIGDKAVFCRCWRSKKFPHCDGSHNTHNKETGDNVGPLIVKKTQAT